jgi:hypothetical protein
MICKDCQHFRPGGLNPREGICTYSKTKLSETQKTNTAIAARMVSVDQEACENIEKGSFREHTDDLM